MKPARPFRKDWLGVPDLLSLLTQRGMVIDDRAEAEAFLRHVSYYRLKAFIFPFRRPDDTIEPGTTFEQVRDLYLFDAELRRRLGEALTGVEIELRSRVAQRFGAVYSAFGHVRPDAFYREQSHAHWLEKQREEAKRSREEFAVHFRRRYTEFPDLPVWVLTEVMSFGSLSLMLKMMHKADQKAVAHPYGLQPKTLVSWVHHLVYVRNLCAHHARVWDRVWAIAPFQPYGKRWEQDLVPDPKRPYMTLLVISRFMQRCPGLAAEAARWRGSIEKLLAGLPSAPNVRQKMGLPENPFAHPCWAGFA